MKRAQFLNGLVVFSAPELLLCNHQKLATLIVPGKQLNLRPLTAGPLIFDSKHKPLK